LKFFFYIFVLSCFFPYLDFLSIGTDTQPNALFLASLFLLGTKDKNINLPLVLLWLVFVASLFLIINNELGTFVYIKNTLNYLSLPVLATAIYVCLDKYDFQVPFRLFLGVLFIYLFFGLMQMYVNVGFGEALLNETRGVLLHGRGVVSLTTEPAFYGSTCLFFMAFSVLSYSKKQNLLVFPLLLAQMFFLSKSATALAIFFLALIVFVVIQLLRFRLNYLIVASISLLVMGPMINRQLESFGESRMGKLVSDFKENPELITQLDESVGVRLTGAIAPFLLAKERNMIPMGLGHYKPFLQDLYRSGKYRGLLNPTIVNDKDKLGGSLNMVLFQLGFIGLLMPLAMFLCFWRRLGDDAFLFSLVLFFCMLFTQLQLMHSMIGFLLGFVLYRSKDERTIGEPQVAIL